MRFLLRHSPHPQVMEGKEPPLEKALWLHIDLFNAAPDKVWIMMIPRNRLTRHCGAFTQIQRD
jgi:hypothetical protein